MKIPKGSQETVIQRTDNTMAKRKRTNNDLQNITKKPKDLVTRKLPRIAVINQS